MKKFLILYLSPKSARDEMAGASPEQQKAGTDAWMQWANKARSAIVELGAPVADAPGTRSNVTGFSILQGNSVSDVEQALRDNPHRKMAGATTEIHELLEVPGMSARGGERDLAGARSR